MSTRFQPKKLLLIAAVVALLGGFGWILARSGPLAPTRVTVAEVVKADLAPTLFGVGTVEARRSYQIGPTVAGRVLSVSVDVGDAVKAKDSAVTIESIQKDPDGRYDVLGTKDGNRVRYEVSADLAKTSASPSSRVMTRMASRESCTRSKPCSTS